jgi:hypothetical protein
MTIYHDHGYQRLTKIENSLKMRAKIKIVKLNYAINKKSFDFISHILSKLCIKLIG